ncbi:MAG: glycine--tRNA ligase subunit beta, partial [Selenomonadaceae bacterium]|nr:glycine--tRNA ligase subunit beta [Selenomonadaceae bacterium]
AIQAFNRVGNLAKNATSATVDETLFKEASEGNLYNAYKNVNTDAKAGIAAGDYKKALNAFTELTGPINEFFDAVMVMDKDEKIKENRLALLKGIDDMIKEVAAFDKIVLA